MRGYTTDTIPASVRFAESTFLCKAQGGRNTALTALRRSYTGGKKITCRKYAAVLNRKEKAENDPIVSLYNRRCGAIRTEVGRSTISKAFGEAAKHLAKEHKLRALADDQYAKTQYRKDMSREALYAEVDRNLK